MTQRDALARLRGAQGLDDLTDVVSRAAAAILAIDRSKMKWRAKPDRSPVSVADEAANAIIVHGLAHLLRDVPIVSEEQEVRPSALEAGFALVDPLDGTREYLAGRVEFTVNVAIISQGRPTVGIIAAPALGLVWRGVAGQGAERLHLAAGAAPYQASGRCAIHTRPRSAAGFVAMISRSHFDKETDAFLKRLPLVARNPCGSSLKFARIAEGSADVYARLARTCEWDVAAGHAILAAAGGIVTAPDGGELVYGHAPDFHVPGFIAWGDRSAQTRVGSVVG
ncbi:MAG TPA: 3'(2'),5'-bisphosphate nucleotidase CysQ [Hyphomicrobiaceae bacterium]|jgi:3'(2'), 5'-bisphosphate nucleotidase|nr:3'(2'),5'-bisphosphate nucleotidase CysQ [Hyphomicrobiaceae bacterium]